MTVNSLAIKHEIEEYADKINISIDVDIGNTIKLLNIYAETKGTGLGTKMMKYLVAAADKYKKDIVLDVDNIDDQNRLIQFYKRFGFKLNTEHYEQDEDTGDYLLTYKAMMSGKFYPLMTYKAS